MHRQESQPPQPPAAVALSHFVLGLRDDAIPARVRRRARALALDTIGAGLCGRQSNAARIVHLEAERRYREGNSTVWGHPIGMDAAGAALVNGTQAHALEFDDYCPPAKAHAGAVVVPAALAALGPVTSGRELITSIVAGYEVMIRVGLALDAVAARSRGFHVTGLSGPFGAAAAAGRLAGLNEAQLVSALGTAASFSAGTFAFSAEGAMTKALHAGRAAEAGLISTRLAKEGFAGPTAALDAPDGGLLRAMSDSSEASHLVAGLGHSFAIELVATKPYPCCASAHSSIDAVLKLRSAHDLAADDIEAIEVHNSRAVIQQCGFPFRGSGGPLEAQMSLQYCLAAAVTDGQVGLRQFSHERRQAPVIRQLARRVEFAVDPVIDTVYPREFPALVRIRLRGGSRLEQRVAAPLGSPGHPMNEDDLVTKFRDLTSATTPADRQERILRAVRDVDLLEHAGELPGALADPGHGSAESGAAASTSG